MVEPADHRARLLLDSPHRAERFACALWAENVPAQQTDRAVELPLMPWYTPADVQSLALAVTKVAYYLQPDGS